MEIQKREYLNISYAESSFKLTFCLILFLNVRQTEEFLIGVGPSLNFTPTTVKIEHILVWNKIYDNNIYVPEVIFKCKFDKAADYPFYSIKWYIDGVALIQKAITQTPDNGESDLKEKDLGDIKYGIDAKTNKVIVERGKQTTIELEFTIPFGCIHDASFPLLGECNIFIEMYYNEHTAECRPPLGVIGNGAFFCGSTVSGYSRLKYLNGEKWTPKVYWNISNDDVSFAHNRIMPIIYELRLRTKTAFSKYFKQWNNYRIADIDVEVIDGRNRWHFPSCYSHVGGTHMMTFDGSLNELESTGVFQMYKNNIFPIEVQIQLKPCLVGIKNGHCVCGVYIRGGLDVFIISTCSNDPFFNFVACHDGFLTVIHKERKKYEIILPTKSRVIVTVAYQWELNITIDAAQVDEGKVEGLCGNLDGIKTNDFMVNGYDMSKRTQCGDGNPLWQCRNSFNLYYRVPENKILFPVTDKNRSYLRNLPSLKTSILFYCVCAIHDGLHNHSPMAESVCSYKRHQSCNYHTKAVSCDQLMNP